MNSLHRCSFIIILLIILVVSEVAHSFNLSCLVVHRGQLIGRRSTIQYLSTDKTMSSPDMPSSNNNDSNVGQMLGGLVFIKTRDLPSLAKFYTESIGMQLWLEQPNIIILHHGNMILGFHQIQNLGEQEPDLQGMYTFVYPSLEQVDDMHAKLQHIADGKPRHNERYKIYQFFAKDPEGRDLEFQAFLHPLKEVSSGVPK
mmetsp:Transcript_27397/g.44541  ORF Transcript_27397/g.44541 Transcript_27397/m.44541 type:complete len:200 (+) Transcript_27397:59-658(+)